MSDARTTKKSSEKNSKVRLPPRRGQIKGRIFRMIAKKVAGLASMVGLRRQGSCVADKPAAVLPPPLKFGTC
ncbi:hypothetical protein NL676_037227 [Syzygium grande]|nr:hypothetical protein NL676_037227 [Syzygium grande]